ncbi:MAG: hypothetical protein BWZ02_02313 [Lentisphaerae bacterium ADurb.BinA184]|nr:MAG: hypothetical protein BWZ02_02313 [Lentisphaerae bacterium ADurb.BinA184]
MATRIDKFIPLIFFAFVIFRIIKAARDQQKAAGNRPRPVRPPDDESWWKDLEELGLPRPPGQPPPGQPPAPRPDVRRAPLPPPRPQARAGRPFSNYGRQGSRGPAPAVPPPALRVDAEAPEPVETESEGGSHARSLVVVPPTVQPAAGTPTPPAAEMVPDRAAASPAAPEGASVRVSQPAAAARRQPRRLFADRDDLRRAVVMRELLDRPRAFDV